MKHLVQNRYLYLAAFLSVFAMFGAGSFFKSSQKRADSAEMKKAAELSSQWMGIIREQKLDCCRQAVPYADPERYRNTHTAAEAMLGDEYTPITTTLGSLEAKQISANPLFASLVVKYIHDADIKPGKKVGVMLSGSFPSLAVSALAALHVLKRDAVIISSLGASSWGANQPYALWIDMERWLRAKGGMRYRSQIVTYGAEGDTGGGLIDEAQIIFDAALKRNNIRVFIPRSIQEAIRVKQKLLADSDIGLFINIGGNQTALGYCSHAETIPNGLHTEDAACSHEGRGIIYRLSEHGIPFIHLLNVKNLAVKNGITEETNNYDKVEMFYTTRTNKTLTAACLSFVLLLIFLHWKTKNSNTRNN